MPLSDDTMIALQTTGMPFNDEQDIEILTLIQKHKAHLATAGSKITSMRPVTADYLKQKLSTPLVPGRFATPHVIYWRFLHLIRSRSALAHTEILSDTQQTKLKLLNDLFQERQASELTSDISTNPDISQLDDLDTAPENITDNSNLEGRTSQKDILAVPNNNHVGVYGSATPRPLRYCVTEDESDVDDDWRPPPAVRREFRSSEHSGRVSSMSGNKRVRMSAHNDDLTKMPTKTSTREARPVHPVAGDPTASHSLKQIPENILALDAVQRKLGLSSPHSLPTDGMIEHPKDNSNGYKSIADRSSSSEVIRAQEHRNKTRPIDLVQSDSHPLSGVHLSNNEANGNAKKDPEGPTKFCNALVQDEKCQDACSADKMGEHNACARVTNKIESVDNCDENISVQLMAILKQQLEADTQERQELIRISDRLATQRERLIDLLISLSNKIR